MTFSGTLKLLAIVIVGLFIIKLASKWVSTKYPNKVTNAVDTVIQTA